MTIKRYLFSTLLVLLTGSIFAQQNINAVPFSALDSLQKKDDRKVVVFFHTDWCKYCQKMKSITLVDEEVIETLNDVFYFVSFDGEEKKDIEFQGHTFRYKPSGANTGMHELTEQLATIDGKVNYPTMSVINSKNEILFQYGGYMSVEELKEVLKALVN